MAALVPVASARLAQDVYLLVDGDFSLDQNIERLKNRHSKFVDINKNSLLTATSGLGFIQARTAFGIAAFGVNAYAGHAFIVLRVTILLGVVFPAFHAAFFHSSRVG